MSLYAVIILAGGEKGPLYEATGYLEKALIPIHGVPMVSRVIETFHACERVGDIVVVGSANLDSLDAIHHVRKRIFTGVNVVQNLLQAVAYVKHRLYRGASQHDGYVISFCDAVFLTPAVVDETLAAIEQSGADIVLHYVEQQSFHDAGLRARRTYLPVGGKLYTGTAIYYVRRFSKVLSSLPTLIKLRKHRKHPHQLLAMIGCQEPTLPAIERALSERLDARVRIIVSPHVELGMDVDKPSDLELATQRLAP